jgi:hypothetical protein
MAIITDRCVFLHIPKTGGTWIKQAFRASNIKFEELGGQHNYFPDLYDLKEDGYFDDLFVFTIVRHPIHWYPSRWAFRVKNGWQARHPLDWNCASNNFHEFLENVFTYAPEGWCNWLFSQYCEINGKEIDFVGRTEFLADDFVKAMDKAGHEINLNVIENLGVVNSSSLGGFSSSETAQFTPELYERVLSFESRVINKYYADYEIKL